MKKLLITATVALLVCAVAYPALARGPAMGQGNNPAYGGPYTNYAPQPNLTDEQRTQLDQLHKKFYDETVQIRNELGSKSLELNNLLRSSNPDATKVKALQKEISDLRAKLDEKRVDFDLEARKIVPEGYDFGMGYGRGHAHVMPGMGSHPGYHRW
ncbi:MAG: periplasmic heavy metal sensor [Deltaproteobacteria bacterium]|nr:periplasmic heavy metal sensor [Deltaproteobacteria bacterium]